MDLKVRNLLMSELDLSGYKHAIIRRRDNIVSFYDDIKNYNSWKTIIKYIK